MTVEHALGLSNQMKIVLILSFLISLAHRTFAAPQQPVLLPQESEEHFVPNISLCPRLAPRATPPSTIHDLRIDDLRVVAALGDSITAAFAAAGKAKDPGSVDNTYENRGRSFSMGGDPGATTLPNMMRHFALRRGIVGPSHGGHGHLTRGYQTSFY